MDFSARLLQWYSLNGRILPWRQTKNPYIIWVSEIILQQTRVEQGVEYFHRFIEKFPDVSALANASQTEVLRTWQGLGYYTRARNLHQAAQIIMNLHAGQLPDSYSGWIKLPGVGPYTASAITSIAFDHMHAVLDGNVFRVIARLFGIDHKIDTAEGKKVFENIASTLLDTQCPGAYNQAMMDFGAMICKPANAICNLCPFQIECKAFRLKKVNSFPVKSKPKVARTRFFNYLYIFFKDHHGVEHFFITQRLSPDIWKNLFELPLIETEYDFPYENLILSTLWKQWFPKSKGVVVTGVTDNYRHKLTHQLICARVIKIRIQPELVEFLPRAFVKTCKHQMDCFPKHRLAEKMLANIHVKS